jgi:5-formyltetrahydrofolate cyclo-ligase
MPHTKTDWRHELLAARRRLDARSWHAHGEAIVARVALLPEFAAARTLLLYEPIGAEPVPGRTPGAWFPLGAATPATTGGGAAGEPGPGPAAAPLPLPVVAVVPGVGFDPHGVRLGRGGGFYDRALHILRAHGAVLVVGVAFELQIVSRLPRDPWDQLVDVIVTEERVRVAVPHDERRSAGSTVEEVRDS